MSRPIHIFTELFPSHVGELGTHDYFLIYEDSVEFDETIYNIKNSKTSLYSNKDDLLRYISCLHDFFYTSENILGKLVELEFDEPIPRVGSTMLFIQFNEGGDQKYYVYCDDGLYRFTNFPSYSFKQVTRLDYTEIASPTLQFATNIDTNATVTFIEEPESETVTEQVLVRDSYSILEVEDPVFEDRIQTYFSEYSECELAQFDTIFEQVLVKDGYTNYEIFPAELETVTESVLVQNKFQGEYFFEREKYDTLIVTLRNSYVEVSHIDISSDCENFDFFNCLSFEFSTVPAIDTILYDVYEVCPSGFESAGKYCYSKEGTVPWIFEERMYDRLFIPATSNEIQVPNEYRTISYVRVSNKEELPSNCILTSLDSFVYQKIIEPPTVNEVIVPAEYGTRTYAYFQDGGEIEVVEGNPNEYIEFVGQIVGAHNFIEEDGFVIPEDRACYYEGIREKLIQLDYLDETEKSIEAFQLALTHFQVDNSLPLGVVDQDLIHLLDVKFGY